MTILFYLLALIPVFFLLLFLGYGAHWLLHQSWSGIFYRKHLAHHTIQYPSSDLLSEEYRSAGQDNSTILFAILFAPIVLFVIALMVFKLIPLMFGVLVLILMALVSFFNSTIHDATHLYRSFYDRFGWFKLMRERHYVHHRNVQSNLSIFIFVWDRVFGTFKEAK